MQYFKGGGGPKGGGRGPGRGSLVGELCGSRTEESKGLAWFRRWWEVQPGGEGRLNRLAGASWGVGRVKMATGAESVDKSCVKV